ncbi:MAG: hypothetical protein WED86_02925, partial [Chloroflexota bacterium]
YRCSWWLFFWSVVAWLARPCRPPRPRRRHRLWGLSPGTRTPPGPPASDESNTRSFTPMIESPEIGEDYDVYLSLHCGYANVQQVGFGGTEWREPSGWFLPTQPR